MSTSYFKTSIGKKQIQGVAGLLLCGFLVVHFLGNLQLLVPDQGELFNAYAAKLASLGIVLYIAEAGLAAMFLIHLGIGIWLWLENRRARPQGYAVSARSGAGATTASRTMIWTGLAIFVFLIVHLWMFKFSGFESMPFGLYQVVMEELAKPLWAIVYVAVFLLMGLHLSHAVQSAFQTLGLNHPKYTPAIKTLGSIFAWAIAAGYAGLAAWIFIKDAPGSGMFG
jgi:succinate dehydrogenase / fumarate reductase cytochrome b subunit